jgi:hypothetical protein
MSRVQILPRQPPNKEKNMPYGHDSAVEANRRLEASRNAWQAGEPTREMHQTVKEIKVLLTEILEILRADKK